VPQGLAITHDVRLKQAQAQVMAQYHMALMLPRSWESVGAKLLLACDDPDFAREAYYRKPAGRDVIEGLSIRFAEHAQQIMRNIAIETSPEMEDDHSVHYRMTVLDLESNTPESETFKVDKTVERRSVALDDTVISERTNSQGEKVYLIPATEDQLNTKLRAIKSKVKRQLILAMIPAAIRTACLERCKKVSLDQDAKDPAGEAKRIIMAFISIGIDVPDLKEYLGKSPANATAQEVESLRLTYALIRDGEITWRDVMAAKAEREAQQGNKAAFVAAKEREKAAKKNKPPRVAAAERAPRAPKPPKDDPKPGAAAPDTAAATPPAKPRTSRRDEEEDDEGSTSTDAGSGNVSNSANAPS
jgi:hypothetical protein